ncbi:hypothetical protein, partial [Mesorhizobium sp. M7A.F.Ca.CA.004.10.1.1]|uniref:hypothetical protein n=1 Tax=Mesorhizobium sp. M7A.F.Ca.CA.004.10.1.1 TaxID=2496697 RepID=UPI0019D1C335
CIRDRDKYNMAVAASLSRDHLARFMPPDSATLSKDDIAKAKAKNESKVFRDFFTSGYKNLHDKEKQLKQVVETYSKVFIFYKYVFDMTQTDNLGGSVDLLSVFTRGTLTSPIDASFEGKRRAKREFVQKDRVDELLTNLPTIRQCNKFRAELAGGEPLPNGAYPIAGKLNLIEIVRSFITSNQSGNLIGQISEADLFTQRDKVPVPSMNETLVFTTTLHAGISPKLELGKRLSGTDVKGSTLTATTERVDIHTLTLVMQLPPTEGGLTVAEARSKAEQQEYERQVEAGVRELQRVDDSNYRDRKSKVLELITGE